MCIKKKNLGNVNSLRNLEKFILERNSFVDYKCKVIYVEKKINL